MKGWKSQLFLFLNRLYLYDLKYIVSEHNQIRVNCKIDIKASQTRLKSFSLSFSSLKTFSIAAFTIYFIRFTSS